MNDNTIKALLESDISKKRLKLNDKYICEFVSDGFSEFVEDTNSPRHSCYADVIAYDDSRFRKLRNAKVFICFDPDLGDNGMHSMTLHFEDDNVKSLVTVVSSVVEEARVQVKEFLKLLDFKPLHDVSEPYDNLGLTVCVFEKHNGLEPNIEFGMDGKLYYEVLDMNDYEEGSIIPIDSSCRNDVVNYVRMTADNIKSIADKINASLHKVYNRKEKDND